MSPLYPLLLDLAGVPALVVGGGAVAARKAAALAGCGARTRVVAPALGESMEALAARGAVEVARRGYRAGDAAGHRLKTRQDGRLIVPRDAGLLSLVVDAWEQVKSFTDRSDRLVQLLEGFVPEIAWLGDAETLTYLQSTVSTTRQPVVAIGA